MRRIQGALDETGDELLLGRYTRYLGGVLVAGILLSVGVGVFAAPQHAADGTDHLRRRTRDRQPGGRTARRGPMAAGTGSLAQAFNGMLDRLEESFVRLSQFSADLAHELHTPISNLRGEPKWPCPGRAQTTNISKYSSQAWKNTSACRA